MTRSELIRILSEKQQLLSYKETEQAVRSIFEYMSLVLSKGTRIEIRGFGSFSVRHRKARIARNPKTGVTLHKKDKYTPFFKAGQEMRERVNTGLETQSRS